MVGKRVISKFFEEMTFLGGILFYIIVMAYFFFSDQKGIAIDLLVSLCIIYLVTLIVRAFYYKDRPKAEKHGNWIEKIDSSSFPSVHAARATVLFIFAIFLYYPSLAILISSGLIWILVCCSRIVLKKHYLVDVIGGVLLGLLSAIPILI